MRGKGKVQGLFFRWVQSDAYFVGDTETSSA